MEFQSLIGNVQQHQECVWEESWSKVFQSLIGNVQRKSCRKYVGKLLFQSLIGNVQQNQNFKVKRKNISNYLKFQSLIGNVQHELKFERTIGETVSIPYR